MTDLNARVIITAVDKVSSVMGGIQKKIGGFGKSVAATGAAMQSTGMKMTAAVTLPAVGLMHEFVKLDSAMGDLDKVFVGTNAQFAETQKIIGQMARHDLPLSHEEITKLFTAANQAGIAFKEQKQWVQLAGEFMVAFDTTAEEFAATLAKMKQTLQLTTPELRDLAGAMNIVANNSAATEAGILGVYEQVVPLVQFVGGGKAARDLAALGGAMVGGMVDPEKAGTGLRNMIVRIHKPTKEVAAGFDMVNKAVKDFNMTAPQMAKMMQTDLSGAFVKLFDALTRMKKEDALEAIASIAGLRALDTSTPFLTALPKVIDLLKQVQDEEKRAASVKAEFEKRMQRLGPQLQQFKNSLMDVAFAVGKVWQPYIESAGKALANFADGLQRDDPKFQMAAKSLGALALAGPGLIVAGTALKGLGNAVQMLAKPGQLLAIGGLGAIVYSVAKNWDEVEPSFNALKDALKGLVSAISELSGTTANDPFASWDLSIAKGVAKLLDEITKSINNFQRAIDNSTFGNWGRALGLLPEEGAELTDQQKTAIASRSRLRKSGPFGAMLAAPGELLHQFQESYRMPALPSWEEFSGQPSPAPSSSASAAPRGIAAMAQKLQEPGGRLVRDVGGGNITAEVKQPVPVDVTGKVGLEGKASVTVTFKPVGAQIMGMSSGSSGDIALDTGVSMQDTGVTP